MTWEFLDRFEFRQYRVQLVFKGPARLPRFHGPALYALLCRALDRHPLGAGIALYPAESGNVFFNVQERYNFGVTLFGQSGGLMEKIHEGLRKAGGFQSDADLFPCFEVSSVNELPPAQFQAINGLTDLNVRFFTPLRMERKDPASGKRFFDTDFFDVDRFLRLTHDRLFDLAKLSLGPAIPYSVPVLPPVKIMDKTFIWIDAPYHGDTKTLGGITGALSCSGEIEANWQKCLFLGQFAQTGRNTAFGFGKYEIDRFPDTNRVLPARTFIDRIIDPVNMVEAWDHVKTVESVDKSLVIENEKDECNAPLTTDNLPRHGELEGVDLRKIAKTDMSKMIYIIVYDISDDKRRNAVADFLKGKGRHIRESVFECSFSQQEADGVAKYLGKLLGDNEGNIRMYPVCGECLAEAVSIGDIKKQIGAEGTKAG